MWNISRYYLKLFEKYNLHYIDLIDARMYDMRKAVNETEPGQFSERLWSLDNRRIYNHGEI